MREILSAIEERLDTPTSRGLAEAVERAIRDGALAPGTRLPPIRTVATELVLSPTTVSAGWSLLLRAGVIHTDGRRGTTVAVPSPGGRYREALRHRAESDVDLSAGVPDPALLPGLRPALDALTVAGTTDSYADEPVLPELAAVLRADWPYPDGELAMVDGAMDGIELLARTTLRFGDRVVLEHPTFPSLIDLLTSLGIEPIGVRVDERGMNPAELARAMRQPVAAVFLQPRVHNPTGISMTPDRTAELANILEHHTAYIVEDDSAGVVTDLAPRSLGSWIPRRTIHVRSFAKSHGPDLRLAAISAPRELARELFGRRRLGQGSSSPVLQRILYGLLTDPGAVEQTARARAEYARRRRALAEALAAQDIHITGTHGLNVWVPVRDESAAVAHLVRLGIAVAPGSLFEVSAGSRPHIRVTAGLVAADHTGLAARIAEAARR
ncbi:PLP-dependent aminotransferase family protein [Nocardia alni]|uniref:aminotransferase-like domain-containing protein n=1 Tax=Nocardia alni TaxID=2815723 RepID=UPI001C210617|nr:aminotransferase class I/II-fold pyridoxal phosphate-dependent enzyme [Nocardia alni]